MSAVPGAPLPPVRRVVTGLNAEGQSTVLHDGPMRTVMDSSTGDGTLELHQAWTTDSAPADAQAPGDGGEVQMPGFMMPNGSAFKVLGFAPRAKFPMHFTHSIDYAFVISGEITLILSDGTRTKLKTGDSLVQLGNPHAFENETDEWCRFLGVSIESKPLETGGKELDGVFFA